MSETTEPTVAEAKTKHSVRYPSCVKNKKEYQHCLESYADVLITYIDLLEPEEIWSAFLMSLVDQDEYYSKQREKYKSLIEVILDVELEFEGETKETCEQEEVQNDVY